MINGVFCHETGCPKAPKKCRHGKMSDSCSVCSDPFEGNELESSLDKSAHIRHENGKWVVYSHDYSKTLGSYPTKAEAVHRLKSIEYWKSHKGSKVRPFSKKAESLMDPYQALTQQISDMRTRMEQVQQRLESNPLPKTAGADEKDNSELSVEEVFSDIAMGLDLLEVKLKDEPESEELHKSLEELENLLWETQQKAGLIPQLSEEEKAEPEHKEVVEEVEEKTEKEAAYDEKWLEKIDCEDCRAVSSGHDRRHYCEKHQPKEASKKEASEIFCKNSDCKRKATVRRPDGNWCEKHAPAAPEKKEAAGAIQETDETITTNDPNAIQNSFTPDPTAPPTLKNVQPTDDDNLEVPVAAPTSPPPPGQRWVFNSDPAIMAYVLMPDPGYRAS